MKRILIAAAPLLLGAALIQGCRGAETTPRQTGNQLWEAHCARCHATRSPASLSDAEWDVAVHHMRVRANLSTEEARRVAEFLKAGN